MEYWVLNDSINPLLQHSASSDAQLLQERFRPREFLRPTQHVANIHRDRAAVLRAPLVVVSRRPVAAVEIHTNQPAVRIHRMLFICASPRGNRNKPLLKSTLHLRNILKTGLKARDLRAIFLRSAAE